MKKIFLVLSAVIFVAALGGAALGATIDFEGLAAGSYASIVYPDVTFTNNFGNLSVVPTAPGPPLSGNVILGPDSYNVTEAYKAAFAISGIRFVSVDMGDYAADADHLYLQAYDAGSNLLASVFDTLPASLSGGHTLSVSTSTDISYVLFNTDDPFPGSIYFDNFTYNPVPIPPTIFLMGGGLAGLAVLRRLRFPSRR
jgi:hypothetical protein